MLFNGHFVRFYVIKWPVSVYKLYFCRRIFYIIFGISGIIISGDKSLNWFQSNVTKASQKPYSNGVWSSAPGSGISLSIKAKIELEIYHKLRIFLHLIQVETLSEAFQKKRTLSSSPEFFWALYFCICSQALIFHFVLATFALWLSPLCPAPFDWWWQAPCDCVTSLKTYHRAKNTPTCLSLSLCSTTRWLARATFLSFN